MPGDQNRIILTARGQIPADVVFSNTAIFNPYSCDWEEGALAVTGGIVAGIGKYRGRTEHDLKGAHIVPGLIDAHVHIESSLLTPREYVRLVSKHGTTTAIADPHEIANVAGVTGIEFMLRQTANLPVDIFFMLPSCVPATPADTGGAILSANDLAQFIGRAGVLGIGEVMNVPGVLAHDPDLVKKILLASLVDGHAPLLSGPDLNAYVLSGMQSDHECTQPEEAKEKLRRGMFVFLREGSTERNICDLVDMVSPANAARCCFATDDCHADMLDTRGHIDNCIRTAISCGLEPELALRMATLSAAERFRLYDRGALSPGRIADFCVVDNISDFVVKYTYKRGKAIETTVSRQRRLESRPFPCSTPTYGDIRISESGQVRVIGIVPNQILTNNLHLEIDADGIPDFDRDIIKAVVCNRYQDRRYGVGLVQGFGLTKGAIAASISHDTHNIIAVGASDQEILRAIDEVIRRKGAMVVVYGTKRTVLPLACAGLMSLLPYERVVLHLGKLKEAADNLDAISDPFMYLSFLSLTVIPSLRVTDRGLFDVEQFRDVPLLIS